MTFKWTDENAQQAIELWKEGQSASYIAERLGCSRSAVLGKTHRMREQFPARADAKGSPLLKMTRRTNLPKAKRKKRFVPKASRTVYEKPKHDTAIFKKKETSKDILELEAGDCRWPEGELFCGLPTESRASSYCKTHGIHSKRQ